MWHIRDKIAQTKVNKNEEMIEDFKKILMIRLYLSILCCRNIEFL